MIFSIGDGARQDRVALIDGDSGTAWTYRALADEVARRRELLGSAEKRLIFAFCNNQFISIAWYLAGLEAGHAVALLSDQIDEQLAANLISLYRPEWIIGSVPVNPDEYEDVGGVGLR